MSGLRWSSEQHAAWKRREAARLAQSQSTPSGAAASELLPDVPDVRGPFRVILPWPPTGNTATRHANGAHYLTEEHKAYRRTVAELVRGMRLPTLIGRLQVHVTFAPPDRRRRDLDNAWKVVGDALQHAGLYEDDAAIDRLLLERNVPLMRGSVCVVARAI